MADRGASPVPRNLETIIRARVWALFLILALGVIPACERNGKVAVSVPTEDVGNEVVPPKIVCTTTIVEDLVRQIGGDDFEVVGLHPAGRDPHHSVLRALDMFELEMASVLFYNGLGLEGETEQRYQSLSGHGVKVVTVTDAIPKEKLIPKDDGSGPDPHVWGDPLLWAECVGFVAEHLKEELPEAARNIDDRVDQYLFELRSLSDWILGELKWVPWSAPNRRILVTHHDAFRYWGRAFQFETQSLIGVAGGEEADQSEIDKLVSFVTASQVPAVFPESTFSWRAMRNVATEAKVDMGGELYSDSVGRDRSPDFTLRLIKIRGAKRMPDAGVSHIFIGRNDAGEIHLRVFNSKTKMIFDRKEGKVSSNRLELRKLKLRLVGLWDVAVLSDQDEEGKWRPSSRVSSTKNSRRRKVAILVRSGPLPCPETNRTCVGTSV